MDVRLKVLLGKSAGQEIPVEAPSFLIGRADECRLRPKSEFISRRHCELQISELRVTVRDLSSRTGTFVNAERIPPDREVELRSGDTLKVGPLEFGVVVKHVVGGKKKPKTEGMEDIAARTAAGREDVDVSQWLTNDDADDVSIGETMMASPGQTLISAADLIGNSAPDPEPVDQKPVMDVADPRQAAADALRKHLRRG